MFVAENDREGSLLALKHAKTMLRTIYKGAIDCATPITPALNGSIQKSHADTTLEDLRFSALKIFAETCS